MRIEPADDERTKTTKKKRKMKAETLRIVRPINTRRTFSSRYSPRVFGSGGGKWPISPRTSRLFATLFINVVSCSSRQPIDHEKCAHTSSEPREAGFGACSAGSSAAIPLRVRSRIGAASSSGISLRRSSFATAPGTAAGARAARSRRAWILFMRRLIRLTELNSGVLLLCVFERPLSRLRSRENGDVDSAVAVGIEGFDHPVVRR